MSLWTANEWNDEIMKLLGAGVVVPQWYIWQLQSGGGGRFAKEQAVKLHTAAPPNKVK